jgi:hypothetical protein
MRLVRSRPCRALLAAAGVLTALALPASASALTFHVVNESGKPASEVFVDIVGRENVPSEFSVTGFSNDVPRPLSSITNGEVTVEKLISGRVYISYVSPVRQVGGSAEESTNVETSPTRFDWAELTVNRPQPGQDPKEVEAEEEAEKADVANLTAVDQFGIGMHLTTFGESGDEQESIGSTYADDVFAALQNVPGGPESTIRNGAEIIRVMSPLHSQAYPRLTEYVHSMAGTEIILHSLFDGLSGEYKGTFGEGGSIEISGDDTEGHSHSIKLTGEELIEDIYTDGGVENTLEGEMRHDLLAGFSLGLWGGKYGNDAINFCTDPALNGSALFCHSFNVPAFAAAHTTPEPYPTYEQYAATIAELGNFYGNPFSDASQQVTIGIAPETVKTLQLTILPDSPPATNSGGNGGGGSSSSSSPSSSKPATSGKPAPAPLSQAKFKLAKVAKFKHGKLMAGGVQCKGACGRVVALLSPVRGKGLIAREAVTARKPKAAIVLKPTKSGKKLLDAGKAKRAKLTVTVTQPGHSSATKTLTVRVVD